jgi:hypothetical protein
MTSSSEDHDESRDAIAGAAMENADPETCAKQHG